MTAQIGRIPYMPQKCPYCDFTATTIREEMNHMSEKHADIIEERLRRAGFHKEADDLAAGQLPPGHHDE